MKVLIVDDDLTARKIIEATVNKSGYETVVADNGIAAKGILSSENPPKIALIDWVMPGMDGLELCKIIRQKETSNPTYIIMLTSKDAKDDIIEGLSCGANDYVVKPFNRLELVARVKVGERMIQLQEKLVKAYKAMEEKAMRDALTGIYNRGAILEIMAKFVNKSSRLTENQDYVAILDLDHFKNVNDKYGHQVGDQVLQGFTEILKESLREYDFIGRYGGEEFLIIFLEKNSEQNIEHCVERIRNKIETTAIKTTVGNINITASIGCVGIMNSIDLSIKLADEALYEAKAAGRNRVVFK